MPATPASSSIKFYQQSHHLHPTSAAPATSKDHRLPAAKRAIPAPRHNATVPRRPRMGPSTPPSRSSASCASLENLSVGVNYFRGDRTSTVVLCRTEVFACRGLMFVRDVDSEKKHRGESLAYTCIQNIVAILSHVHTPKPMTPMYASNTHVYQQSLRLRSCRHLRPKIKCSSTRCADCTFPRSHPPTPR